MGYGFNKIMALWYENTGIPGHRIEFNRHIKLPFFSVPSSASWFDFSHTKKNYVKVVLNSSSKLGCGLQIHVIHPIHR
jgi:hypothetical protein